MIRRSSIAPTSLRTARRLLAVALVGLSLVGGAAARDHGDGDHRRREGSFRPMQMDGRGARQAERAQQRAAGRAFQQREMSRPRPIEREDPRAVTPPVFAPPPLFPSPEMAPGDRGGGRPGRLSPEERRALRQQINEAGRDVYRPVRP